MGTCRVILPTVNPCFECRFAEIHPYENENDPFWILNTTPRIPAHCVEWGIIKFADKYGFFFLIICI
jgi:hypothetical protein